MAVAETDKATRYIAALDAARCNGIWADLPELARKVEKHAGHRKCLATTARVEAAIQDRLATDGSAPPPSDLAVLTATIEANPADQAEDAFEAAVCVGWALLLAGQPSEALGRMPAPIADSLARLPDRIKGVRRWVEVSAIKAVVVIGQCHERLADLPGAARAYGSALPFLVPSDPSAEAQAWALRLLSRLCVLSAANSAIGQPTMLGTFRRWAAYWSVSSSAATAVAASSSPVAPVSGSAVWLAYYRTLTDLLATGMACDARAAEFEPKIISRAGCGSAADYVKARAKLRAELSQVGAAYEAYLLESSVFPRAGQANGDMDDWVDAVMVHWRAETGPNAMKFDDFDGDQAYRISLSRNVLQLLYRAASKTFLSTLVLRSLFAVHAHLGEFVLAMKALDSYIDIAFRARDRSIRFGLDDPCRDGDEAVVATLTAAVNLFSRYGGFDEAEKVDEVGRKLAEWMEDAKVSPHCRAVGLCAIGASKAHWTRWMHDQVARPSLQQAAIADLQLALSPDLGQSTNPDMLFQLGLLLAETGEITKAIKMVRRGLSSAQQEETKGGMKSDATIGHLALVPLWHLLALLLSATGEFESASRACDAAFDLLGLNSRASLTRFANFMSDQDKEALIELRMTQMAALSRIDGPAVAAEASSRLLSLLVDLYGSVPEEPAQSTAVTVVGTTTTPTSSASNGSRLRSIRRSFGRPDSQLVPPSAEGAVDPPRGLLHRLSLTDSLPRSVRGSSRARTVSAGKADHEPVVSRPVYHPDPADAIAKSLIGEPELANGRRSPSVSSAALLEPLPKTVFAPADVERRKLALLIRIWVFVAGLFIQSAQFEDASGALEAAAALCKQVETAYPSSAETLSTNGRWLGVESVDELWAAISAGTGNLLLAQERPFDGQDAFELALSRWPDHTIATVGLSALLLDMFEGTIPLERRERDPQELPDILTNSLEIPVTAQVLDFPLVDDATGPSRLANGSMPASGAGRAGQSHRRTGSQSSAQSRVFPSQPTPGKTSTSIESEPTALELQKLAARDRAAGLLVALSRRPSGWDCSEVWYSLGRASKAAGDIEKAKEQFWWCVSLEERKPVRGWAAVGRRRS